MPILWLVIILGVIEGLTEYLPVSSTGHLIVATEMLGFDPAEYKVLTVAIQPGAILAIVVLYWRTFLDVFTGVFERRPEALRFVRNLVLACVPAIIIALSFGDQIETLLGRPVVVAWALIIGGIAILILERVVKPQDCNGVANLTVRQSGLIGLVQCLAMIPGVSRSGATIMGAMALGVDRKTAAEFSFFLAMPTLGGATAYFFVRHHETIRPELYGYIGIGALVSFIVALIVVKAFVGIVTRYGFGPFAWYRIIAGSAVLAWLALR
jgi:undecaprenyl-diphosphatase